MRQFLRSASRSAHLPLLRTAENTFHSFTSSGRALFYIFAGLLIFSAAGLLYMLNDALLVSVPAKGGTLTEGIVGSPRFVNPVLAVSDADLDLVALVYSGLLKATPQGAYVSDLAERYEVSEDGTIYTVYLRENNEFHDGEALSASDVVFTVVAVQNSLLKSPLRASWDGVSAEVVDPLTVRFTLKQPYAPFIKNLTLGILPEHLWQNVSSEDFPWSDLNTAPIGSGPFFIHSTARNTSGIPSSYELRPFAGYALGEPYLQRFTLRFYQSEDALAAAYKEGQVESAGGISPALIEDMNADAERSPLNRAFGVFFNQNQSEVLRDHEVREALSNALDREALIAEVLAGFGTPLLDPVPPALLGTENTNAPAPEGDRALAAREMLIDNGWEENAEGILQKVTGSDDDEKTLVLSFSISTGNVPELRAAAEHLRSTWERMGAAVEVRIFEQGDLSQNVIRPRKYDALLFGEVVGRELDLYAFWHSSQRNDPGLNVALYANSVADDILEDLRTTAEPREREELYAKLRAELSEDIPAVFLYAPDFVYLFPSHIQGLSLGIIEDRNDRFLSVQNWHEETESVWPFLTSATRSR